MERPAQLGLMIAGCAALLIGAVALPALILRPASHVAPPAPAAGDKPTKIVSAKEPPRAESAAEGDGLSREERFQMVAEDTARQLGLGGVLSSALARTFAFPHARDDAVFGIDVSHHNTDNCGCKIDWSLAASQKVAFVYAKATEGRAYRDPTFDGHWRDLAQQPKILRGAYHFLRADADPEAQAKIFLAKIGKLRANDLPPVLDLEWDTYPDGRQWAPADGKDHWSNLEPDAILDIALKWLQYVERETGRTPVIYTSRTWWVERIGDEKKLARISRYKVWISAMEGEDLKLEKPGVKGGWSVKWDWQLWQFTNKGDLSKAGIRNPKNPKLERVDVNIFPGTMDRLQAAFALPGAIQVVENIKPEGSDTKPSGATSDSPTIAAKEPPKEQAKEEPKEAPTEPQNAVLPPPGGGGVPPNDNTNVANNAGAGSSGAPAGEPPKEPPKEAQVAALPAAGNTESKPSEGNADATPGPGGGSAASETQQEPPKEMQSSALPAPEPVGSKPSDSVPIANPNETGGASPNEAQKEPPSQTQSASTPSTDAVAPKPSETPSPSTPVVTADATPPGGVQKETSTASQSASAPGANSNVDKPEGATEGPTKEVRVAAAPATNNDSESDKGPGKVAAATTAPDKQMIEIVLLNGRVLRVAPDMDPAVLLRLIALLEK